MQRPCTCNNVRKCQEYTSDQCRLCWLYYHDAEYNKYWEGNGKILKVLNISNQRSRPCIFLGKATGEVASCKACTGTVSANLFNCDKYQTCTIDKLIAGTKCCSICDDHTPSNYPEIKRRHLIYHLMPVKNAGVWRRSVAMLVRRMDLFNGTRAVAIAVNADCDLPEKVIKAFQGTVKDFIIVENDSKFREVKTFLPLWAKIKDNGPEDATFCCHGKGVTKPVNPGVTVHTWGQIMFESCLDYWPYVSRLLKTYPTVGSFKKVGHGFEGSESSWHYSGTFYWLRNEALRAKPDWTRIDNVWWGTESYPSLHFSAKEAGCIFYEGTVPELNVYEMNYMRGRILPQWEKWRKEHERDKTDWESLKN